MRRVTLYHVSRLPKLPAALKSGLRHGKWTVISLVPHSRATWLCRCDCGVERQLYRSALQPIRSCGCLVRRYPPPAIGAVIGRWTVIAGSDGKGDKRFVCRCACGVTRAVRESHLRVGSRGCSSKCPARPRKNTPVDPIRAVWRTMIHRCHKQKSTSYPQYGGRGIVVCERWRTSFALFKEDIGPRPSTKHSIDRINNDGPYEPKNCRWATRAEQARNRRSNLRKLTLNGETLTVYEWAVRTGITHTTLTRRLKQGWSDEAIITTPARR